MKWKERARRMLAIVLVCLLCAGAAGQALAANETASTVTLARTEGTVSVTNSSAKKQEIRKDMRLYGGYHVSTKRRSYAWSNLDNAKSAKLDAVSEMELRKSGKKLELLLSSGNLYFNVTEPLKDDEAMNIRTSTMVMGIRGTCGWVKVIDAGHTRVYLLEGTVECSVTNPVVGQTKTTTLTAGEYADFYVYDPNRPGDKCDIIKHGYGRGDIDGFVLVELVGNDELIEEIYEESGIDLRGVTAEEAERRLHEDEDEVDRKLSAIEEAESQQEHNISKDPVWEEENEPEPIVYYPADPAAPTPATYTVTVVLPAGIASITADGTAYTADDSFTVTEGTAIPVAYATDGTYVAGPRTQLTANGTAVTAGSYTVNADTTVTVTDLYQVVSSPLNGTYTTPIAITAPVTANNGTTFDDDVYVAPGGSLTVPFGNTVTNNATVTNEGTVTVDDGGTFNNYSYTTFLNESGATLSIEGDFVNGDAGGTTPGRVVNKGTVTGALNFGQFTNNAGSAFVNESGAFDAGNTGSFTNFGSVTNESGATFISNGGFRNSPGIVHDNRAVVTNKGTMEAQSVINNGKIVNNGQMKVGNSFQNNYLVHNAGTLLIDACVFRNGSTGGDTSQGAGTVTNTGTITNQHTISNFTGNTIQNSGTIESSGTFTNTGTIENSAEIKITGGTFSSVDAVENVTSTGGTCTNGGGKYSVWFDSNGGSGSFSVQSIVKGGKITSPGVTERDGYTLKGWCKVKDGTTPWDFDNDTVQGDMTLYAMWQKKP